MATLKQAFKWMEEGKKVFKLSEPSHVYYFKNGEYFCSCGVVVDWGFSDNRKQDWKIYKIRRSKKAIITDCPQCFSKLDGNYCNSCLIKWGFDTVKLPRVTE